jgi:DNA helicase II / ATP-dependent DNA helicase PcrA
MKQRIVKRLNLNIQPNTARSRISGQKAQGISWQELDDARHAKSVDKQDFVQVYREYEVALASSNLLDYDDLLLRCVDLLRNHPQCVSNVQAVLVDEFQDTNVIQYELMNLFAARHRHITIVGDPDQSIYGFRSAEIKNLERMQKLYKNTSVVLLEDNYRSSGAILGSAEQVIEQDTARPVKKLLPTHGVGTMPVLRKLPSAAAEAHWMVAEIKRCIALTGELLKPSDFAILLRSASLSRQIESELGKRGVPYRMVGGSRFFDRVEIRLLLDYLRVVSHPENNDALARIINVPTRKIGEETLKNLTKGAESAKLPLWTYIKDVAQGRRSCQKSLSKAANIGLSVLVGLIESARRKLDECLDDTSPRVILEFTIAKLGFRDYLTATYPLDEENRWANVEELLAQACDPSVSNSQQDDTLPDIEGLEQNQGHLGEEALSRFLANVALSTEITTEEEDQSQEKVTISTIHAAKGLEWPVVFVAAVYEGIIPHSRAEDSDEERRLLYVAMTRAQALLYLSLPRRDSKNGEETKQSSFLPSQLVETKFRVVGPKFNDKTIFDIADILGRDHPTQEAIVKGLQAGLPSVNDDLFTQDGEYNSETATRWDGSQTVMSLDGGPSQENWSKRRRLNDNTQTATTAASVSGLVTSTSSYTMSSASGFSVSNSTMSMGFSTARQHMETAPAVKEPTPVTQTKPAASSTRKGSAAPPGQGTLAQYFGVNGQRTQPLSTFGAGLDEKKVSKTVHRDRPAATDTSTLTGHGVSNGGYRIQPQRYQPPRPVPLAVADANNYTWLPSDKSTAAAATGDTKATVATSHRPAATFHTTTTTMMPTTMTSATTMSQLNGKAGRKTLGVRRSLNNGWAERMNRANQQNGR